MPEQQVIEGGTLDLKSTRLLRKPATPEYQLESLGAVPNVKLRTPFLEEARRFKFRQHPHLFKKHAIVRQQRFADMESRKLFFLEHQHSLAGFCQKGRGGTPTRPSANHDRIINCH